MLCGDGRWTVDDYLICVIEGLKRRIFSSLNLKTNYINYFFRPSKFSSLSAQLFETIKMKANFSIEPLFFFSSAVLPFVLISVARLQSLFQNNFLSWKTFLLLAFLVIFVKITHEKFYIQYWLTGDSSLLDSKQCSLQAHELVPAI